MARVKIADKREIPRIPLKQISVERVGSPFLTNTEQQHIRESELPGTKIKNIEIRQSGVVRAVSGSLASGDGILITSSITTNDAILMKPFIETNIYLDNDLNLNYLWNSGANVLTTPISFESHYNIINRAYSGLESNEGRCVQILVNNDSGAHTYYLYFRWFYFVIKSRNQTGSAVT